MDNYLILESKMNEYSEEEEHEETFQTLPSAMNIQKKAIPQKILVQMIKEEMEYYGYEYDDVANSCYIERFRVPLIINLKTKIRPEEQERINKFFNFD